MEFPKWVQGHGGVPTIVHSPAHEARVVHGPTIDDDNDPEDRPSRVFRNMFVDGNPECFTLERASTYSPSGLVRSPSMVSSSKEYSVVFL